MSLPSLVSSWGSWVAHFLNCLPSWLLLLSLFKILQPFNSAIPCFVCLTADFSVTNLTFLTIYIFEKKTRYQKTIAEKCILIGFNNKLQTDEQTLIIFKNVFVKNANWFMYFIINNQNSILDFFYIYLCG